MRGYRAGMAFDGERELPGGALILVDGGLVVGVEPGGAAAPDGVDVTEFDGTLLPGLIDAHVHLCADSSPSALDQLPDLGPDRLEQIVAAALRQSLAIGVTTVRDLGDLRWTVAGRAARPGEPRVLASGPPITTPRGHCWNMGGGALGEPALRRAVRERFERGVDVVKLMASGGLSTRGTDVLLPQFTGPELRAVADEAHGLGLPVTMHAHSLAAVEAAVLAGTDGLEHVSGMTAEGLRLPSEDVLAEIRRRGVLVGLTPGLSPSAPEPPPYVQEEMARVGFTPEAIDRQLAGLVAAGLPLLVGGDSGINPVKPHGVFPESLGHLTRTGLTPAEALALGTSGNADGLGLGRETGRLRPGLAADLLVVDGDPLRDITALRDVRAVVRAGERVV